MYKIRKKKYLINKFFTKVCQRQQQIQHPKQAGRWSELQIIILAVVPEEQFSHYSTLWNLQDVHTACKCTKEVTVFVKDIMHVT